MTADFLLTAAARTLSLASVARMSDEQAERVFVHFWCSANNGHAYCPHCGCTDRLCLPPPERCTPLALQSLPQAFSVTSGTLFAFHKMPLRAYLMAVAIFANIRRQVPRETELYADEAGSWNDLHARYTLHRIAGDAQQAERRFLRILATPSSRSGIDAFVVMDFS